MRLKHASLIPTSLVLILAGCAASPAPSGAGLMGGKATGSRPAGDATGISSGKDEGTAAGAASGTDIQASLDITAPGAAAASTGTSQDATNGTAASPADGMRITAAAGGLYVSADGGIKAQIPPDALSKDAVVSIRRLSTDGQALDGSEVPGIRFAVDLGGARLRPDSHLTVTAKVDARFVDEMKRRDPAFAPEKYNLVADGEGWMMQMPVNGPVTHVTPPSAAVALSSAMMLEFGSFALPGATATRKVLSQSSQADCDTWQSTFKASAPTTTSQWRKLEGDGTFSCGAYDGQSWFMHVFYDLQSGLVPCGADPSNPDPSPAPLSAVEVPAHVTFVSDDPAVDGHDGFGADVKYDFTWSPTNGPAEVIADASGNAVSYTVGNLPLTLTAALDLGPAQGASVDAIAAAGMAPVQLSVGKYSPKISVDLESDVNLPEDVTVSYLLDGAAGKTHVAVEAGHKDKHFDFYVIVPNDDDHTFSIADVDGGADAGLPNATEDRQIHRNGVYAYKLKLVNRIPH